MDAVYLYSKYAHPFPHDDWTDVKRILVWLGENWNQPDEGIWEVRGMIRIILRPLSLTVRLIKIHRAVFDLHLHCWKGDLPSERRAGVVLTS
jgi:hypothetical protein